MCEFIVGIHEDKLKTRKHTRIHTYMHTHTSVATIRFKQLLELLRPQTSICDPQNIHPLIMAAMFCCASSRAMRGWVQAFKCFGVTLAYQGADEHQGEELILRAEGPQQVPQGPRRGQEPPAPDCINPCPCCYYTSALKVGEDRSCGWR